jgi:hypothetical protein
VEEVMDDLRRLHRFNLQLPATIKYSGKKGKFIQEIIDLLTSNVCSGGAYFSTKKPLSKGTDVNIDLRLPKEELCKSGCKRALIKVHGKVIRVESKGMAICFNTDFEIKSVDL